MKLVIITDTGEHTEARCDRCRHWHESSTFQWCGRLKQAEDFEPKPERTCVYGTLYTAPEHGCALFEVKP